jgi:hypothetical protein
MSYLTIFGLNWVSLSVSVSLYHILSDSVSLCQTLCHTVTTLSHSVRLCVTLSPVCYQSVKVYHSLGVTVQI